MYLDRTKLLADTLHHLSEQKLSWDFLHSIGGRMLRMRNARASRLVDAKGRENDEATAADEQET